MDIEKMLREALDSGKSAGDIAEELASTLNKLEAERKAEVEKKKAEAEAKAREANAARAAKVLRLFEDIDALWDSGEDDTNMPIETIAFYAAKLAAYYAAGRSENANWDVEDIDMVIRNISESIKLILKGSEGHVSTEERIGRFEKMLFDELNEKFKLPTPRWNKDKVEEDLNKALENVAKFTRELPQRKPVEMDKLKRWLFDNDIF